jgi:hypothetical protein
VVSRRCCVPDGDGELDDEELRIAVTAMGLPPTWELLKSIKDLAPKGKGVNLELVRLPCAACCRIRLASLSVHGYVCVFR